MVEFIPVRSERQRLTFGRARDLVEIPDMIEVQRDSYNWFCQEDAAPEARVQQGLQELLHEVFPIESYDGSFALEFVRYLLDEPSTEEEESRQRDLTWSRPIRATIRLVNRKTKEMKEEEIFLGDFPLMTGRGTFIINGTERVVVNQLARSAGVYFTKDEQIPGQEAYSAKIIPDRGAWLEFSLTPGDLISVNIDNRKKIPATLLLKIFGASTNEGVLDLFDAKTVQKDVTEEDVKGMLSAESVLDQDGSTVLPRNRTITREHLEKLWSMGRTKVLVWDADTAVAATLEKDGAFNTDEAMVELFRKLRPNEPARIENAREYVHSLFFDPRRYNLGRVGRYKMNRKLGLEIPEEVRLLTKEDLVSIIRGIIDLKNPEKTDDDIDHLGNRRVRSVGELLQNQIRTGDVARINGTSGAVGSIELRTTTLRDFEGIVHIFQNGKINSLSNLTKDWSAVAMDIGVAYKENVDQVMEIIRETGADLKNDTNFGDLMLESIEVFGLDKFGDSAVSIKARIKTKTNRQWDVGREFNRRLKMAFDNAGIEIPFPHTTIYWGEEISPLKLELQKQAN